ncbi:type II toxin-antitoxin system RelE/ParE family toxin [Phenylobacterium sp.]|uniref:type II toxin-antitoxin system RelE/ParE family toxin n=1 Tax=Phenylobacterium sp. TaxID=1871053 RepID=UPI00301C1D01
MPDRRYRLSRAADADLERLYEWGVDRYGMDAADQYYDGLTARLGQIADSPQVWQGVDHIRAGYRRSVYGAHSIYYCVEADGVLIARVLGRENPQSNLLGN